jgi:hypothetical protein
MNIEFACKLCFIPSNELCSIQGSRSRDSGLTCKKLPKKKNYRHIFRCKPRGVCFLSIPFHEFSYTVVFHLSGLIGTTSLMDKQKIRIIGCFFENVLLWHSEVQINF